MYTVSFSFRAQEQLAWLKRYDLAAAKKIKKLYSELQNHPRSGTGHPEQLKHQGKETWSRRITKKHRLVYEVEDSTIRVLILSVSGHYNDK